MNYRGVIIKESLEDKSILKGVKILSKKIANPGERVGWHMLKVEIPAKEILDFTTRLTKALKRYEPWYAHFYHEDPELDRMIVVFADKKFLTSKDNPERAVKYGLEIGILREQLDFKPNNVSKEEW